MTARRVGRWPRSTDTRRWLTVGIVVVAVVLAGCGANSTATGSANSIATGSTRNDLRDLQSALDTTINEAKLKVTKRTGGESECVNDMVKLHQAGAQVFVDLQGEDPEQVSHRVAEVWRRNTDQWFGGGLTLDESQVKNPGLHRVSVGKPSTSWAIEASVPYNRELGEYLILASAPCR